MEDLLDAARLRVASYSVFHPRAIAAYAKAQGEKAAKLIKQAVGKIFGVLDTAEEIIHIDDSVTEGKQLFLTFHETGHHELPHQRKLFRFFEDSEKELDPAVADLFEREANNFARFIIFNGDVFRDRAAEHQLSFASVKKLQRAFKVSLYAALREYTRTHRLTCFALCCEPPAFSKGNGWTCEVRRIEVSPSFGYQFGNPSLDSIAGTHPLATLVPFGRRVTRPTEFILKDKNGVAREFIGEALDTTYHVLIFACLSSDFQT